MVGATESTASLNANGPIRANARASADLTQGLLNQGMDPAEVEKAKKKVFALGGFQNSNGHSSLLMPGPVPKPDPAVFLSPQLHSKSRRIAGDDFSTENVRGRNALSPLGSPQ